MMPETEFGLEGKESFVIFWIGKRTLFVTSEDLSLGQEERSGGQTVVNDDPKTGRTNKKLNHFYERTKTKKISPLHPVSFVRLPPLVGVLHKRWFQFSYEFSLSGLIFSLFLSFGGGCPAVPRCFFSSERVDHQAFVVHFYNNEVMSEVNGGYVVRVGKKKLWKA